MGWNTGSWSKRREWCNGLFLVFHYKLTLHWFMSPRTLTWPSLVTSGSICFDLDWTSASETFTPGRFIMFYLSNTPSPLIYLHCLTMQGHMVPNYYINDHTGHFSWNLNSLLSGMNDWQLSTKRPTNQPTGFHVFCFYYDEPDYLHHAILPILWC